METFVARQSELLALEREAELEQTAGLLKDLPVKDLCVRGLALQKLWITSSKTGLYGRTILTLAQRISVEFPAHSITSGDIVGVVKQGSQDLKPDNSGVVVEVRGTSIAVAFTELSQDMDERDQFVIVKLANDVTYRRLNTALERLNSTRNDHLADILLGAAEPSLPLQVFAPNCHGADGDIAFINNDLDESQRNAVRFALKQKELGIIHGPPGSGKTTTIVEIILQSVRGGDKVLVTAPSNVAVDNLLERLASFGARCIRLGHPARVSNNLQKFSLDALISSSDQSQIVRDIYKEIDEIRSQRAGRKDDSSRGFREIKKLRKELREREKKVLKEVLSSSDIVLGTLTSSGEDSPLKYLAVDHFSLAVIDECSQALEMACWMTVPWSKKLLLAGDHLQLPPTILSKKASKELEVTMMERLVNLHGEKVVQMLTMQYRMNKLIMQWSSDALYAGQVVAGPAVSSHRLCDLPGVTQSELTETVLLLIDTAGSGMDEFTTSDGLSKGNEGEARLVCANVVELVDAGIKQSDIAVITPYNLQVEVIRMNLHERYPKVEVRSVDGYQGREKEVVILSMVRSNSQRELGFLSEQRRLNVAVTRARRQVICICDTDTVSADAFIKQFVEYMSEKGTLSTPDMYPNLPYIDRPDDQSHTNAANAQVDQLRAKKKTKRKENKATFERQPHDPVRQKSTHSGAEPVGTNSLGTFKEEKSASMEECLKSKFEVIIQNFLSDGSLSRHLSVELNANERRLVHELADAHGLVHDSVGEGKSRHIVLRKAGVNDLSPEKLILKGENLDTKKEMGVAVKVGTNTSDNFTVTCVSCGARIPKANMELHKLRCKLREDKAKPKTNEVKVKKKKKKGTDGDEDFDQLCEQFQELSKVCNYDGCKVKVATIGANCSYCRVRFCLSHSMAELHGCGEAVRRDRAVNTTSSSSSRSLDPTKRKHLSRKLNKKIDSLSDNRRTKPSDK